MLTIQSVLARSILDSKGNPTIETSVTLSDGSIAAAATPSGTSVGKFEAHELRDGDQNRYHGKGVSKAVENVNTVIAQSLVGKNPQDQESLDSLMIELDGTKDKSHLGANAMLSVSLAIAKAGATTTHHPLYKYIANLTQNQNLALPKILSNLINGGLHAGMNLDIQEFLVIPYRTPSIKEALRQLTHINVTLREVLVSQGFQPLIGDEGGFAPPLETNEKALVLLEQIIQASGLTLGNDMFLGMDAAANSYFENDVYKLKDNPEGLTGQKLSELYKRLIERYHIMYLEDPFSEEDISSWEQFAHIAPQQVITTGDDLTVTNPERLAFAIDKQIIRGIIIKPNQIGTLTETLRVVKQAKKAGLEIIVSHRSGETNDDAIADIAVGVGSQFVKFGAPVRGERVAKYNRLLQIEQELTQ